MSVQQLLLGAGGGASGYNIDRSVRFRRTASANLTRTPAGSSNQGEWTWSGWVKRGQLGATQTLFSCYAFASADYQTYFGFTSDDKFQFYNAWGGASSTQNLITTQVFRDPSAWYHVVVAVDMSQGTYQNAIKIYVNGVQVTAFGTSSFTNANNTTAVNSAQPHAIGVYATQNTNYFDGYLAEVNFINGQDLTPASFGSTNATSGVWQPAPYTDTYGTNGFYLKFTSNSTVAALGTDFSGNGNTWTVNNISVTAGVTYDSMTDVPTLTSATVANYPTLNPIYVSNIKAAPTLENANLTINPAYDRFMNATMSLPATGKFYWEATIVVATTGGNQTGLGVNTNQGDNREQHSFVSTLNDVWGVAVDMTGLTITWYKNNVSQSSRSITANVEYFPFFYTDTNLSPTQKWAANFGQRPFAYTPPTGFVALNTFNLPTATILKGNTVMDATLYTGNNAARSITNAAGFQPDLVWMKDRTTAYSHMLYDSVRGVGTTKMLSSNLDFAEGANPNFANLTSFDTTGFSLGTTVSTNVINNTGDAFVAWQWQAGQGTTSSNTNGSITSTVSVNPTAGFSVVTYTGTGANATVGHGLGVAPKVVVVKGRTNVADWQMYHVSLGIGATINLNAISARFLSANYWGASAPTSSVFGVGTLSGNNNSSTTYVAYCFADIDGYSKFGSYTGNGSTDGAFIYTGFRPRFVMVKQTNDVGNWIIWDTARSTYNQMQLYLSPNSSSQELNNAVVSIDSVSNGFKCRTSDNDINGNGDTYIYMAFAENPFRNSLAR